MADLEAGQPLLGTAAPAEVPAGLPSTVTQEHWSRSVARKCHASLSNLGMSMFFGLITAIGLKTIGQSIAIALVLLFLGFQVLAYYGFVNFNWTTVGGAVARRLDLNADGQVDLRDMGVACKRCTDWALSWGVPSVLGFTVGFWTGWRLL